MRAYLYLFFHTFIGSILKLFRKSFIWILVMMVAMWVVMGVTFGCIGGLAGYAINKYMPSQAEENDPGEGEEEGNEGEEGEEGEDEKEEKEHTLFGFNVKTERDQISRMAAGIGTCFVLLVIGIAIYSGTKEGMKMFSMADIHHMFTSPLKPQSNLLYKMLGTIWTMVFIGFYIGICWTGGFMAAGFGILDILAAVLVYAVGGILEQLVMLVTYLVSSSFMVKKYVRPALVGVLIVLAGLAFMVYKSTGDAATTFMTIFDHPVINFIPVIGWTRAILACTLKHQYLMAGVFLLLSVVTIVGLIILIYRFKADFYEDAFDYAEKLFKQVKAAEEPKAVVTREKNRSKLHNRNKTLKHGQGANVFFFKALYLRGRSALFGIFSLKMLTLLVVIGTAAYFMASHNTLALLAYIVGTVVVETVAGFANPLAMDMDRHIIHLCPESEFSKLLYSLLGNTLSTLIDVLPGMILGAILIKANVWMILCALLITIGMSVYASATAVLMDSLIPENMMEQIKSTLSVVLKMLPIMPVIVTITVVFIASENVILTAIVASIEIIVIGILLVLLASYRLGRK